MTEGGGAAVGEDDSPRPITARAWKGGGTAAGPRVGTGAEREAAGRYVGPAAAADDESCRRHLESQGQVWTAAAADLKGEVKTRRKVRIGWTPVYGPSVGGRTMRGPSVGGSYLSATRSCPLEEHPAARMQRIWART